MGRPRIYADGRALCHPERTHVAKGLCRPCYTKEWRARHPEKSVEQNRNWRRAHPEHYREARRKLTYPIVYICHGANKVIYVGRGTPMRLTKHPSRTAWWSEVVRIRKRSCQTWADSLVLEALLIRKYQPKYNVIGVSK